MIDRTKFTADPQLDSEGFVMADARCHGCSPHEMCPRSGHCERAESPLRFGPPHVTPRGWPPGTETWAEPVRLKGDYLDLAKCVFEDEPCAHDYSCLMGGPCLCKDDHHG